MNYESMSEHEINRRVLFLTNGENGARVRNLKSLSGVMRHGMDVVFDPCNNIEQAWEIILKNKIDITFLKAESGLVIASNGDIFVRGRNPLRVAMICFLRLRGF